MYAKSFRRVVASCLLSSALAVLAACHLTPQQAAIFDAIDAPICDAVGGGLSVVTAPLGSLIALLCPAVASDIVAAETSPTASASAPVSADAGAVVAKSSALAATANCVAVPVPGDPLHQSACPELHAKVLASSQRLIARAAAAKAGR